MVWLNEHKNVWRGTILVFLLVAILGPWWFDLISVPAEYACTTAFRLQGDFCGIPMSGTFFLFWIVSMPVSAVVGFVTGAVGLPDFGVEFFRTLLISLFLFSFVLPFLSTLFLIFCGENPRRRVFHIIVWGLAAGAAVVFGLSSHPELFWVLWGVWLYCGLAFAALILELLTSLKKKYS